MTETTPPPPAHSSQPISPRLNLMLALLGAGILLIWAWLSAEPSLVGPMVAVEVEQIRADTVLPSPQSDLTIQQSFTPRRNGLREIELTLARSGERQADEAGRLALQLLDEYGAVVASQELDSRTVSHNQTHLFRFPAQQDSAGRTYTLRISGSSDNPVSIWGFSLDVYDAGELSLESGVLSRSAAETEAHELRFVARYQLTWADALSSILQTLAGDGLLMLLALAVIPLPGVLLLQQAGRKLPTWNRPVWWAAAFALGIAVWPLIWMGLTLLGGRWHDWTLWAVFILGWLQAAVHWYRRRRYSGGFSAWETRPWHDLILLAIIVAGLGVRLLAVRDQQFPPWVDSSRHALITAVMVSQGQAPDDYAPYLPVDRFPYHFGFHTLAATLALMGDWPMNRLLLILGQLLNGLIPLAVFAGTWIFTRRRLPGLVAAFLTAFPFFFPAYYATWGRMTQLTAMFLMPLLTALTWQLVRGGRRWRRTWWLVGSLAAGLFLVHIRVFFFYLPWAALVCLVSLGGRWRWMAAAAGLGLLLTSGRIYELVTTTNPIRAVSHTIPNYNAFPISYVQVGWERAFIGLAAAALLWVTAAGLRRRRWSWLPLALAGWVGLLFLLLAGRRIGLPETGLINLNSMYITLFWPLSLFLAITADRLWRRVQQAHWIGRMLSFAAAGAIGMAALLFGVRQQVTILNPQTILAREPDLAGLQWAADNLPADAQVAVSSWLWLGNTWAASDGGAWLLPMTRLSGTTPPIDHIYNADLFSDVRAFNEAAEAVADWSTAESATWLRAQGITHVFVGNRGGYFDPAALNRNPEVNMLYDGSGVFVFALQP